MKEVGNHDEFDEWDLELEVEKVGHTFEGFQFNVHGVCINPATAIEQVSKTFFYTITYAQDKTGFSAASNYNFKDPSCHAGGGALPWANGEYPTKEAAILDEAEYLLKHFNEQIAEDSARNKFKKQLKPLEDLIESLKVSVQNKPKEESYRESFGLALPPAGTIVTVEFMSGLEHYIAWPECPDGENVLYGWLKSKKEAESICKGHGWHIQLKLFPIAKEPTPRGRKKGTVKKHGVSKVVRSERMEIRCTPGFKEVLQALKEHSMYGNCSTKSDADILHKALEQYALHQLKPSHLELAHKVNK